MYFHISFVIQEKFRLWTCFLIQECIFVPPRLLCLLGSHLQTPDDNSLSPFLLCIFGMQAYSSEYFWYPTILIKQFTSALTPGNPGFSTVHFDLIFLYQEVQNHECLQRLISLSIWQLLTQSIEGASLKVLETDVSPDSWMMTKIQTLKCDD